MNEFELMVLEMREAQRLYFRTKKADSNKNAYMIDAKQKEKAVDDYLYNKFNPGLF